MAPQTPHGVEAELVAAALRAPSSHNSQPWVFEVGSGTIRLHADRTRALAVSDPLDRELTISCGAALFNLRVAAAAAGLGAGVELLPDPGDPDLLAQIELDGGTEADGSLAALRYAIDLRQTNRHPYLDRRMARKLRETLMATAETEGAWLSFLPIEARAPLTQLVARGDRLLFEDRRWRRELAAWTHPRRSDDGLRPEFLPAALMKELIEHVDLGAGTSHTDEWLCEHSGELAVIGTGNDNRPQDWITAGQALQRVLLTGAAEGVQASFLNQPIQVPELRPELAALTPHDGELQIGLRLGYPRYEVHPSRRRPVAEVMESLGG